MQRWCAFSTPQVHSHPKTLSVSVSSFPPASLSPLLFHPTLLDFLSPTGSPDDTTASTFLSSLPISAHIIFWFWLYFKKVLRQVVLPFLSFILTCIRKIQWAAQTELLYTEKANRPCNVQLSNFDWIYRYTGHMHMYAKTIKNLSSSVFLVLVGIKRKGKAAFL